MHPEELATLIRTTVQEALAQGDEVISKDDLRELMHDAVVEGMSTLGIDARNPLDVQKDMQFVRELRLMSEKVKQKTYLTIVALIIGALAATIWLGFKGAIQP